MLPTDLAVSVPIVVVLGVAPVVEWFSWPIEWRAHQLLGEPGSIILVALLSLALLIFRSRSIGLRTRLIQAEAEAVSLQKLARVAMGIRDLTNTPLQTLTVGLETMKMQSDRPEQTERLLRAVRKINELNRLLEPHTARIHWKADDASFDARTLLRSLSTH
jgi:hypothetical protein